jgi:hypothetical protein
VSRPTRASSIVVGVQASRRYPVVTAVRLQRGKKEMSRHDAHSARTRRLTLAALACCAIGLGACGSSGNTGTGAQSGGVPDGVKFADCMRAHHVPSFPDPGARREIQISLSPAFQSAQTSCQHLLGGSPGSGPPSPQAHARLLQNSACMRRHGISSFPDPRAGSPPSSPAGYSLILGSGGYFLAIPNTINPASPAFKQAATACKFGPPHG